MVWTTSMAIQLREEALRAAARGAKSEPAPPSSADVEARRLATAVARGDEAAFQELYDQYHERLFRLVVVLNRGDEALAHEVVQLTMLTAATKLKPVETQEHLWHWLARVAHQHLTKAWRHRRREPLLVDFADLSEPAVTVEPDAVLEETLDAALLALEEEDRQTIEWFYFDGLSHKEIAQRLDITPKAVSSRLDRSRAKLRLLLKRKLSYET
jgi:RNA polymerase sigma-70 factor (ECF subfamily)